MGYTVKQEGGTFTAYKDGKMISKGCLTENDALHSIWIGEGRVFDDFYVVDKAGAVSRVDRGTL